MDYLGAGLLLLAVAASLFMLNLGGQILPWSHPVMIFLYVATPVFIILFFSLAEPPSGSDPCTTTFPAKQIRGCRLCLRATSLAFLGSSNDFNIARWITLTLLSLNTD